MVRSFSRGFLKLLETLAYMLRNDRSASIGASHTFLPNGNLE